LFHDINVHKGDFGVGRFWDEIKTRYASTEFQHGYGLGVLAMGKECPTAFEEFLQASTDQAASVHNLLFDLGYRLETQVQLAAQQVERERAVQTLNAQTVEREHAVQTLTAQLAERDQVVETLTAQVVEKEQVMQALPAQLAEKEQALLAQLAEKDGVIGSLQQTVAEQTEHLDALGARLDFMASREIELRALLLDAHEQLRLRDEELLGSRREVYSAIELPTEQVAWLEAQIRQMKATRIWQLGMLYWHAHAWVKARWKRRAS
jgi:uncharacterized coiled-coil protein SlyX